MRYNVPADATTLTLTASQAAYGLAAVVIALGGVISKMAHHIRDQQHVIVELQEARRSSERAILEAQREAEVKALREVLPIAQQAVEVLKDLHPILDRLGVGGEDD